MRHLLALMAMMAIAATAAADDQVYKWTDASGQVHYSALPPPTGHGAERIQVDSNIPTPEPEPAPDTAPATTAPAEKPDKTPTSVAAASPEQCETARANLKVLTQGGANRRFRTPDGDVVRFTPEELQARIDQSRAFLDQHCGD